MAIYDMSGDVLLSAFDNSGNSVVLAYDVNANEVLNNSNIDYDSYTVQSYCSSLASTMQGFDIFSGVIFQCSANNTMATINVSAQSLINSGFAISSDHGDSVSFSSEYYDPTDTYPLLYITADTNPAKVYVNRVTTGTATLIKILLFPLATTGYYAAHAYDEENQVMYMLGYSENNYLNDNGGSNKTVVSSWDMTDLTENQDGSFTPGYIDSIEIPFIFCMQGQQFHDGMIWVSSGYYTAEESYVYAIDPGDGTILHTIDLNTTNEVEGLAFISNTEMVVGIAGGVGYKKYTFTTT